MLTVLFFQLKFIYMIEASLSKRLLEAFLKHSYSWFLDKHSGDLGKGVLSEVSETIHYSISRELYDSETLTLFIKQMGEKTWSEEVF